MSIAEVRNLTLQEKLQFMEAIWLDLREHVESSDTPHSHRELLDARRERAATGQATIHDWEQVKHTVGRP